MRYEETVLDWARAVREDYIAARNLSYGADPHQRYDVFAKAGMADAPVLVFWHGGGWTNGYKEYVSCLAPAVVERGFVLVAPGYRLAPADRLPAAYDDALSLLTHLREAVSQWGGNPDRLYLSGHSAGGGIAAMAAMRAPANLLPAIRACLPISGIMDLHHPNPMPQSLEERVYTQLLPAPELDAAMSPLSWAAANTVPMVLSYGELDSERVIRSNRRLFELLKAKGLTVRSDERKGEDHFLTHIAMVDGSHPWYELLAAIARETI